MKKRILAVLAIVLICSLGVSACKKNVGTPEDNAASEESEDGDEGAETEKEMTIGFTGIDMKNPYFITLESAIREVLEEEGYRMITKDPGTDPDLQASQIKEMI